MRGRGYRVDDPDPNAWTTERLFGTRRAHAMPLAISLDPYVDHPRNQLHTSSCVGWALAMAIYIRLRVMGYKPIFPSASAIYNIARALARLSPNIPLEDIGCQPGKAIRGVHTVGVVDENEVPFDPETINEDLTLAELEIAREFLLTGYYRINTKGGDASEDACWALSNGYPIIGGTQATDSFDNYDGSWILDAPDPLVVDQGHMIVICGYKTTNGKRRFRGLNSWGPDPRYPDEPFNRWGDQGFFWCTEEFVQTLRDKFVITVGKNEP